MQMTHRSLPTLRTLTTDSKSKCLSLHPLHLHVSTLLFCIYSPTRSSFTHPPSPSPKSMTLLLAFSNHNAKRRERDGGKGTWDMHAEWDLSDKAIAPTTAWRRHPDVTYFDVLQQTNMLQKTLLLHAPRRRAASAHPKSKQCGPCRAWHSRGRNKAHRSQLKSVPPFCSPNPFSAELPLPLHPGWCILSSLLLCVCACVCVCMHVCACMCVPMCARTCVVITTQQQSSLGRLVLVTFADLEKLMFCLKS